MSVLHDEKLFHGEAVAIDMVFSSVLAHVRGHIDMPTLERIIGFSGGRYPNLSWALGNRVVFPSNNTMVLMDLGSADASAGASTPTNHVLGHGRGSSFSPHHSAPITIVAVNDGLEVGKLLAVVLGGVRMANLAWQDVAVASDRRQNGPSREGVLRGWIGLVELPSNGGAKGGLQRLAKRVQ